MKKLVLIDGNSLIYRAFYGSSPNLENILRSDDGTPTNALVGFARMIEPIICNEKNVLIAFDSRGATFRHEAYADYKGTRSKTPIELITQKPLILEYLNKRGVPHYFKEGFEADDVIASMSKKGEKDNYSVHIYTSDRDLLQLASKTTTIHLIKKGMKNIVDVNEDNFQELVGVKANQFIDYKALTGDSSDNIKGVQGVGPKTSVKLLNEYGNIDNIYNNLDKLSPKIKEKFEDFEARRELVKMLVSLKDNFDIDIDIDFTKTRKCNREDLYSFLHKYQINTFKIKEEDQDKEENEQVPFNEEIYEGDLNGDVLSIFFTHTFSYYSETSRGLAAISTGKSQFVLDVKELSFHKNVLKEIFGKQIVYTNDSKLVLHWAAKHNINSSNLKIVDLNLITNLIDSRSTSTRHSLAKYKNKNFRDLLPVLKIRKQEKFKYLHKEIVAATSLFYFQVADQILENLKSDSTMKDYFYTIEEPLVKVLTKMELNGIGVDSDFLEKHKKKYVGDCEQIKKVIFESLGEELDSFNIDSPGQLAKILFDKLGLPRIKKNSTDVSVLEQLVLKHESIGLIMEFRKKKKILSTYILPFLEKRGEDGRIHPEFHQAKVVTGRISTTNPSIQNLAKRNEEQKKFRQGLSSEKDGKLLIAADYSQIELRILAHLSKDEKLISYFENSIDVHKITAANIFGVDFNNVTKQQRSIAKTVNFGVIYGMGPFMLAKQLQIPVGKAKEFIEEYFRQFPKIKEYKKETIQFCQKNNYVETINKRRRYLYDINSSSALSRAAAEREAVNMRIQGSQSEVLKIAMIEIHNKYKNNRLKMIGQIHDELIFEVDKNDDIEAIKNEIKNIMISCVKISVPLSVNISHGINWFML